MTREETQRILMAIQAAYPNYKPQDKTVAVNTWCEMLSDYTYQQISVALKAYIVSDNSGFPPSIGQLVDKIQMISGPQELNEMEAWSLVSKALRNGYYGAEQEFANLPPLVQEAVGSPANIRNWSQTDIESIENVIQSNFIRTYRTVVGRKREYARLPEDVRKMIGNSSKETTKIGVNK